MKYLDPSEITDEVISAMLPHLKMTVNGYWTLGAYTQEHTPHPEQVRRALIAALCDRRKGERRVCKDGLTALKDASEPNPCPKHGYDFYPACKHCYLSALRSTITPPSRKCQRG